MRVLKRLHLTLIYAMGFMVLVLVAQLLLTSRQAEAADTRNFDPANIMSDPIFTDYNSMSVGQIQSFLESKGSTCLRNFSSLSINDSNGDGLGDEPYGKGINEQVSAATVIWQAAQLYRISPKVILATLQKEQGLITRGDCPDWRYNTALGYGCPDTAPCNNAAYGFTRQIDYGVWHFRGFFDDSYPIPPITPGNRYIAYNPTGSCGGSTINIQNRATAALYSYTPYQPNAATLAAAPGQIVNCGAYGNINFWRYFSDWFGSPTNPSLNYSLIKSSESPAIYLQTPAGKYYIPTLATLSNWGIDGLTVQQVSQSYIDSLATGPWVGNVLKDDWNNYSIVEGGKLHYVRDASYLSLWGINPADAVQSLGLSYSIPSGDWAGRFIQDKSQPSGPFWLIDKGKRHLINDASMMYHWRYTSDQLTTVSTSFLDSIPTAAGNVSPFATTGSTSYTVDTGRKLTLSNSNIQNAYYGSSSPVSYDPITLSYLPTENASRFAINATTGQWFMLEGGKRHYIPTLHLAELWGKRSDTVMTTLSGDLMNKMTDAGELAYIVQTASPSAYWLIDGNKRYIPDAATSAAWLDEGVSPPLYSSESLALMTQSSNATSVINAWGSPYTYVMINGIKHYLSTASVRDAWGSSVMQTVPQLVNTIPEGIFVDNIVQDQSDNKFLLMAGKKYPIDNGFKNVWNANRSTIKLDDAILSNFTQGSTLKAFIKIGNQSYVMTNGGAKSPISRYSDAYQAASLNEVSLPSDYSSTTTEATYLIRSTDVQDERVWLMNNGKKHLFSSFSTYVSYGYLSRGLPLTTLTPETLALIPAAPETPGLFIRPAGSYGVKFINFGASLGFPDGDTLFALLGSTPILVVSDSIYNSFSLGGSVSRVIRDDAGKIYFVEDGKKRWITNGNAYNAYRNYPVAYLFGTTMAHIPDSAPIN